jgi:hypothetical protein
MPTIEETPAVLFGNRDQVIEEIERGHAQCVVAVQVSSAEEGSNLQQYLTEALAFLAQSRHDKLERTRERWFRAYLENMADNTALPENLQIEAQMTARAQARVLKSKQFYRAVDISKLSSESKKNPSGTLNRWKQNHQIFAIERKGTDYYPIYALSQEDGYKPYPEMKEILKTLEAKTSWGLAFWFDSPNSYLRKRSPKELMKSDRRLVLAAAKNEAAGILHG